MARIRGLAVVLAAAALAIILVPTSASAASRHRDYDCADFNSQAEAEEYLLPGDPYNLDADGDGIACEGNPCPCSSTPGGGGTDGGSVHHPPPPPKPPKLNKGAAKSAAKAKLRRYLTRNHRVASVSFSGCGRRSRTKIVCRFLAEGEREFRRTVCRIRVRVTGEGNFASAKLRPFCRSHSTLFLTAERALGAIREAGGELAEKLVVVRGLERTSRVSFEASAEWRPREPARSTCFAEFSVRLLRTNRLSLSHDAVECEARAPG